MKDIFKYLESLVAINRSQYRGYLNEWRGRADYSGSDYIDKKENFVLDWVSEHRKEFDTEKYKENFIKRLRWDKYLLEEFEKDAKKHVDTYFMTLQEQYNCSIYDVFGTEDRDEIADMFQNDEDILWKTVIRFMETKMPEVSKIYQEELRNEELEYYSDQRDRLEYEGAVEFEKQYGGIEGKSRRINVSKVYEPLFTSLKGENPLNTKYRIYLPIEIDLDDISTSSGKNIANNILYSQNGNPLNDIAILTAIIDVIIDYFAILGKEENTKPLYDRSEENMAKIKADYIKGYYYDPVSDRPIRIGKIINFMKKKQPDYTSPSTGADLKFIENLFVNRPSKGFKGYICISRHPRDIAAMSTDQGWTSCMDLNKDNTFNYHVEHTIMNCGLIAYLVKEGDEKVQHPTSRLLLKAYVKGDEEINYEKPNWILVVSDTYGTVYGKFSSMAQDWANKNWNSKVKGRRRDKYKFNDNFYFENEDKPYHTLGEFK